MGKLDGKVVIITGAASGIGHALSLGFLNDGAKVVAVDIKRRGLEPLTEKGAIIKKVDVTDPDQVEDMIRMTVNETGRLDVLINNAGLGTHGNLIELSPGEFEKAIQVNLFGPVYGMRFAIPVMRSQGFGRIINLISRAAEAGVNMGSPYGSSKAALWAVTRCVAMENADLDILINGLIPGPTKSGMMPWGQKPEKVYPSARWVATLPKGGPTGKVFWNQKEYVMFDKKNETFNLFIRNPNDWKDVKLFDPNNSRRLD